MCPLQAELETLERRLQQEEVWFTISPSFSTPHSHTQLNSLLPRHQERVAELQEANREITELRARLCQLQENEKSASAQTTQLEVWQGLIHRPGDHQLYYALPFSLSLSLSLSLSPPEHAGTGAGRS